MNCISLSLQANFIYVYIGERGVGNVTWIFMKLGDSCYEMISQLWIYPTHFIPVKCSPTSLLDWNIHINTNSSHIITTSHSYYLHLWQLSLKLIIFTQFWWTHWQTNRRQHICYRRLNLFVNLFLFHHKWCYSLSFYDSQNCHRHSPRTVWSLHDSITLFHEYSHDIINPSLPYIHMYKVCL